MSRVEHIAARPAPDAASRTRPLVDDLPFGDRIPRRSGDVAFDHAWEIRAFSMTLALHEELGFAWSDFQQELIAAIRDWEAGAPDHQEWSYYERWTLALEQLAGRRGWVSPAELDARTEQVLAQPPTTNHHHAVRDPLAVAPGRGDA